MASTANWISFSLFAFALVVLHHSQFEPQEMSQVLTLNIDDF